MWLFLAVLGLHCCTGSSLVAASGDPSLVAVLGLLVAVVSLVEHGLSGRAGVSSGGPQAREHRGLLFQHMWDRPRPGVNPVSPELAGGFFTPESPGEPQQFLCVCDLNFFYWSIIALQCSVGFCCTESESAVCVCIYVPPFLSLPSPLLPSSLFRSSQDSELSSLQQFVKGYFIYSYGFTKIRN